MCCHHVVVRDTSPIPGGPWTLETFVHAANTILARDDTPSARRDGRLRDTLTPRLVRHHTTEGLLDPPHKAGREARYTRRHLLQLLVLRRMLAAGYAAPLIAAVTRTRDDDTLEAILHDGTPLETTTTNPALEYLQHLRAPSASPANPAPARPAALTAPPMPAPSMPAPPAPAPVAAPAHAPPALAQPAAPRATTPPRWTRVELAPGIELHLRDDAHPATRAERDTILERVRRALDALKPH